MDTLYSSWIDTNLGPMLAIADDRALYLLEFANRERLEWEIKRLKAKRAIVSGKTDPITSIERELDRYFKGECFTFETPTKMIGTPFQCQVWSVLQKIPPGITCAYTDVAEAIGRKGAVRAVAGANGANQLAIIIPCHRVRNADGSLAGYGGGVARKQWLIDHEKQ